eukprot:TRINITY_DN10584_c0_g1_i2.p1 TRINITY_DN10584_c0_g1~~TRINITY_DN10584_c0_g1_i2.p1  ORF type:complete len:935 (-),score=259.96 TRINITY_DN10584_c0_g1_i2:66-2870(-)
MAAVPTVGTAAATAGREWLLSLSKAQLRDDEAEAACRRKVESHRSRPGGPGLHGALEFQELDLSENLLSWRCCKSVVDVGLQCTDLRVVKLFRNQLSDQAVGPLCRLVEHCRSLEQLHLSYNRFTSKGASDIILAVQKGRAPRRAEEGSRFKTLWLRLEYNRIQKPTELLQELREDKKVDFCEARDALKCGPRTCKRCSLVHLPYFSKQESAANNGEVGEIDLFAEDGDRGGITASAADGPAVSSAIAVATGQCADEKPQDSTQQPFAAGLVSPQSAASASDEDSDQEMQDAAIAAALAAAAAASPAVVESSPADDKAVPPEDAPAAVPPASNISEPSGNPPASNQKAAAAAQLAKDAQDQKAVPDLQQRVVAAPTADEAKKGKKDKKDSKKDKREEKEKDKKLKDKKDKDKERGDKKRKHDKEKLDVAVKQPRQEELSVHRAGKVAEKPPAFLAMKPVSLMKKLSKDGAVTGAFESEATAAVEKDKKRSEEDAKGGKPIGTASSGAEAAKIRKKEAGTTAGSGGVAGTLAGLGNIAQMQKLLAEERKKLKMWIIKAKQEWEERQGAVRGETNEQEYYNAAAGEVMGPSAEYRVEGSIGRGVFSSVFKARDTRVGGNDYYAVKLIRSNLMMRKAAEKEVEMYRRLTKQSYKLDAEGAKYIVALAGTETFNHQGHMCMVFELLKCDLRTALARYGQGKGLPLQTVAQYSRQIFLALRVLRKLKIIHSDLKPDNVLMTLNKTEVKVCDFGSAMDCNEECLNTPYLQPRYYRAPEVILGSGYDTAIDIWSAGVMLFELVSGKILLTGKTNNGMLHEMLEVSGALSQRLATSGAFSSKHFNKSGDFLIHDPQSITGKPEVASMKKFLKPSRPVLPRVEKILKDPPPNADEATQKKLIPRVADLVTKCLRLDPSERFTPDHALAHTFYKKGGNEDIYAS